MTINIFWTAPGKYGLFCCLPWRLIIPQQADFAHPFRQEAGQHNDFSSPQWEVVLDPQLQGCFDQKLALQGVLPFLRE